MFRKHWCGFLKLQLEIWRDAKRSWKFCFVFVLCVMGLSYFTGLSPDRIFVAITMGFAVVALSFIIYTLLLLLLSKKK
ncbi:hypothetical protein BC351_01045 [Paenibacillus ferrarius]|uniref:Uncharacterized protein n=1 Tax=Paenibacillus ferrarius TaxID=1469647 RepID=A0A1V4HSD1_9BACL|nr:hypothetical protein BC351_01045 [Paenibacillus ferrarius]